MEQLTTGRISLRRTGTYAGAPVAGFVTALHTDNDIEGMLIECAKETLPSLVRHEISLNVRRHLADLAKVRLTGDEEIDAALVHNRVAEAVQSLHLSVANEMSEQSLHDKIEKIKNNKIKSIENGSWKIDFRGRDVLNRFVSNHVKVIKYEYFRNLIITKMQSAKFEPSGMKEILLKIV